MIFQNPLRRLMPGGYMAANPVQQPLESSPLQAMASQGDIVPYPTPILDEYDKLLNNPPNPNDYAPSRGRRILGALAAMGAGASPAGVHNGQPVGFRYDPEAAHFAQSQVNDAPYDRAMKQYDTRAKQLGQGADVEERAIGQKRGLATLESNIKIKDREDAIRQEQAEIARKKENDIYETKNKQLQDQVDKAEAALAQRKAEAEDKNANFATLQAFHQASLDAQNARHALDIAQRDRVLEENKRKTDIAEGRAKAYEAHLKELGEDTSKYQFDKDGNLVGSITTTKGDNSVITDPAKLPPPGQRKAGVTKFKFPDGSIGTWDAAGGWKK